MAEQWFDAPNDLLVAECIKRPPNEEAWLEFWKRFHPLIQSRVLSVLLRFTKSVQHNDLDDIIQSVFLKILRNLDRFDPARSPLEAYLSMVSANVVIDQLRKHRTTQTVALEDADADALVYSSAVDFIVEWDAVASCLKEVGEPKASIIEEYLEGGDVGQICLKYGLNEGNVYTIVSRFRKELRNQLRNT